MTLLLTNEITTPILNFRFFLKQLHTPVSWRILNDFLFATLFFAIRVVFNTFLIKEVVSLLPSFLAHGSEVANVPAAVVMTPPILAGLHVCLQYYWFALIVRMIVRKMRVSASPENKAKAKAKKSPKMKKVKLQEDYHEGENLLLMDDDVADPMVSHHSNSTSSPKQTNSVGHLTNRKRK
jgi:hypothetical protein